MYDSPWNILDRTCFLVHTGFMEIGATGLGRCFPSPKVDLSYKDNQMAYPYLKKLTLSHILHNSQNIRILGFILIFKLNNCNYTHVPINSMSFPFICSSEQWCGKAVPYQFLVSCIHCYFIMMSCPRLQFVPYLPVCIHQIIFQWLGRSLVSSTFCRFFFVTVMWPSVSLQNLIEVYNLSF